MMTFSTIVTGTLAALGKDGGRYRRWHYKVVARILGLRVIVRGNQSTARPQLVVCNHISYLDIIALGSAAEGAFVAKADIAKWPVFGIMAKAGRSIFVDRRRAATGTARDQIQERLEGGEALIMFPEAASGDGTRMLPFKSALFTVAERHITRPDGRMEPVIVQPASMAYTRLNGLPIGVGWRSFFAWFGDMELMPHLWHIAKLGTITVEITFHTPVSRAEFPNRKALAAHCEKICSNGMALLLAGRSDQ
jgi:1-acyl-sn-glycerol-3-phosphate acyltransferase